MAFNFRGTGVAVVTPFNEDYSVDFESLEKIINHLIKGKVEYLVVLGTTGETATLSTEEKQAIFSFFPTMVEGKAGLVAGIGGNNTFEVIEQFRRFDLSGYNGILSVSPYYNRPNQEGIYRHYEAICSAAPLPVILYNVPARTGSNMTPETTLRIAKNLSGKVIGTKEASGSLNQCMDLIINRENEFLVISGDDNYTLPYLACGMDGVISVIANAYPHEFSSMVRAGLDGDFATANEMHYKMYPVTKAIYADGSPGGIKFVLSEMGLCKNIVRLPLAPVNSTVEENLRKLMKTV